MRRSQPDAASTAAAIDAVLAAPPQGQPDARARERLALEPAERGTPPSRGERYAAFTGGSYNADTRTAECVFATPTPVNRWWYVEILEITDEAVDLGRVATNLCRLLFNHRSGEPIGAVTQARVENGLLVGTIRFNETPEGDRYAGMVQRGELTGISVGYDVTQWTKIESAGDKVETWRATRWGLLEASLVAVPADPLAGVRSAPSDAAPAASIPGESGVSAAPLMEEDMKRNQPGGQAPTVETAPAPVVTPEAPATRAAEPAPAPAPTAPTGLSVADAFALRSQAEALGVLDDTINGLLTKPDADVAAVRAAILAAAAARQTAATAPVPAGAAATIQRDERDTQREGMIDALTARMTHAAPSENGRRYMGFRMVDLLAERAGFPNLRDPVQILERAFHTTSDFPLLLEAAANKTLLASYGEANNQTYRGWSSRRNFTDFKPHSFLRLGDFPDLVKINESGEIKAGTLTESRERVRLETYARAVSVTRQMLVNDDLGAFGDFAAGAGRACARNENTVAYALLLSASGAGPTLSDNVAMFHANHANLASASVIDVAALGAARALLRKQKNLDGKPMNLDGAILLVGPDKELEAERVLAPVSATQVSNVNPFSGRRQVIVDAWISGNQWYNVVTPSGDQANFVYGFLGAQEGPMLRQDRPFSVDGISFGVIHDFGFGAIDHRFMVRNPGA